MTSTGASEDSKEAACLGHVLGHATRGDSKAVLDAIDKFCYTSSWMMNVGDVKGKILRDAVKASNPTLAVEFGGYCGYSAVLIGSCLAPGSKLVSIEMNPVYADIARRIIEHAGLAGRVEVWVGDVPAVLPKVVGTFGSGSVDLVLIDHWKDVYLRDLHNLESHHLLHPGSTIVADNVLTPGAPDYLKYIQSVPDKYANVIHETTLEYSSEKDWVVVTQVLR